MGQRPSSDGLCKSYINKGLCLYPGDTMNSLQKHILHLIVARAAQRAGKLSKEYLKAKPHEKEAIQAGIEFEKWFINSCRHCLPET